ncbi:MAG: hypothetical protein K9N35_04490 [Candidatus Marinimicrobia bacterium]|nr:hypothetical protein [Candidatus Neomarinimicrobiota bacterium]
MDESDGDKLRTFLFKHKARRKGVASIGFVYLTAIILFLILNQPLFASRLGGFSGTASRFTADPIAAGTGGITLFHSTSTNSYTQNPSSLSLGSDRRFDAGMVRLSLDRFIYTMSSSFPLPPTAHLAIGLIAAGTNNIQARDSRGYYAGELNDTEMSYLVSFSNRFSEKLSFGLALKYLAKEMISEEDWFDLKGTGFGAGIGMSFSPVEGSTFALALKDWNSSYTWKTQEQNLYEQGSNYQDQFPMSISWGWLQDLPSFTLAFEHDYYFIGENIFRTAIMWNGIKNLHVNAGLSYEDDTFFSGASARYRFGLKQRYPMHLDLGLRSGVSGEGLRNYIGWGLTF